MSMFPCGVCGRSAWTVVYEGPIRDGVFGKERNGRVVKCGECTVEALQEPRLTTREYYADGTYRKDVGEEADVESFQSTHDREQAGRVALLNERVALRGRVIADVGCGGGSFLDAVSGMSSRTIAIEPTTGYHDALKRRGHAVFPDLTGALKEHAHTVNVAVCFSVIEHLDSPTAFLSELRTLLAPGGLALISTPNLRDVLMASGSDAYRRFFYRAVHLYYFDEASLAKAAALAGFSTCEVVYKHRFPFSNFMGWLRECRPNGAAGETPLSPAFDRIWTATLEAEKRADYLYAFLSADRTAS